MATEKIANMLSDIHTTMWLAVRMNSARTRNGFKISPDKESVILRKCATSLIQSKRYELDAVKNVLVIIERDPRQSFLTFHKLITGQS